VNVGAALADVLPGRRGREDIDRTGVRLRRLFHHHDRVRAGRQRGARGDFGARAAGDDLRRYGSSEDAIQLAEADGDVARGALSVGCDDRVAVHRRSRERRDVDRRSDSGGGDTSRRVIEADAFDAFDRTHVGVEPASRFVEGDGRCERTHCRKSLSFCVLRTPFCVQGSTFVCLSGLCDENEARRTSNHERLGLISTPAARDVRVPGSAAVPWRA
jgi:hypothetical protein